MGDDALGALRRAGAAAVRFNSPLGVERAAALAAWLGIAGTTVLDVGCGHGAFARLVAGSGAAVIGVDDDAESVERCRAADPLSIYLHMDAERWVDRVDGAACIGSSHAFGGEVFERLASLVAPGGRVVVGEAFWARPPSSWCVATFGDLDRGADEVTARARRAGLDVVALDPSTPEEWDAFEEGWCRGVGAVGTGPARDFAAQRRSDYQRYRGVLGFAWLQATRGDRPRVVA